MRAVEHPRSITTQHDAYEQRSDPHVGVGPFPLDRVCSVCGWIRPEDARRQPRPPTIPKREFRECATILPRMTPTSAPGPPSEKAIAMENGPVTGALASLLMATAGDVVSASTQLSCAPPPASNAAIVRFVQVSRDVPPPVVSDSAVVRLGRGPAGAGAKFERQRRGSGRPRREAPDLIPADGRRPGRGRDTTTDAGAPEPSSRGADAAPRRRRVRSFRAAVRLPSQLIFMGSKLLRAGIAPWALG